MAWQPIVRDGVGYALPTVGVLYLASRGLGVSFGNLVFGITAVTALAWVLSGIDSRPPPTAEANQSSSTQARPPLPRLLIYATGVSGIGWALALLTLV